MNINHCSPHPYRVCLWSGQQTIVMSVAILFFFLISIQVNGQIPGIPRPGQRNSQSDLIDAINHARDAYQIELLAVATYEAALATPYLKDDTKTRAQDFYADHKKHADMLLDLLDRLGGKSDDIKQIKKNYNGLASEREVIDHLIRAEENSEKELSNDTKKVKNAEAKRIFEQIRDSERAHLKAYEPLKKAAIK